MLIMLITGTLTKLALVFAGNKEDQKCVLCLYLTAVVVVTQSL